MSSSASAKVALPAIPAASAVVIGKDLLELISTAMYVDPLNIYREYVQNAADAIDEARAKKMYGPDEHGSVEITLDAVSRTIRIRDNGAGTSAPFFAERLRSLGASIKRGTEARGFRGVGRLAGLAYGQRLTFRSRSSNDEPVMELVWDCRRLRAAIKDTSVASLAELVEDITTIGAIKGDWPEHFFEVEIGGVVRLGDDRLLSTEAVSDYLAQVAPVPFHEAFELSREIESIISGVDAPPPLRITMNAGEPITRPHRTETPAGMKSPLQLRELTTIEIPGTDGNTAAVGWVAHHDYEGAIPNAALVKGLRLRVGNIQIGDGSLLEEIFPETRFNSWTVGEIHVLDRRVSPNGRRDNFEQNVHFANLLNQLSPTARDIARRCRTSSNDRKRLREFEMHQRTIEERFAILRQGALGDAGKQLLVEAVEKSLTKLHTLIDAMPPSQTHTDVLLSLRLQLGELAGDAPASTPLDRLPAEKRTQYQEMFDLIYDCSVNRNAAKALVDRILEKII